MSDNHTLTVPPGLWTGVALVATAALLFALGDRPHIYYQNLRWVVTLAAAAGLVASFQSDRPALGIPLLAIAFVFAPSEFVAFRRETWFWVNVAAAAVMFPAAFLLRWDLTSPAMIRAAETANSAAGIALAVAWTCVLAFIGLSVALSALSWALGEGHVFVRAIANLKVGPFPALFPASLVLALGWLFRGWQKTHRA